MQFIQWKPVMVGASLALSGWTVLAVSDTPPASAPPAAQTAEQTQKSAAVNPATPLEITGVHNAFRLSPKLISGSMPEGDAAFKALSELGVKTIITVDGAKPDVEGAKKYGMRYVQIPFGYDGLPHEQSVALARAVRDLPGPIFIHCHHGKHRGPTAAACVLVSDEGWKNEDALSWMKQAGAGANYTGLWDAIRQMKPPTAQELAKAPHDFPSVVPPPALAQSMVKMDGLVEHLQATQKAQWQKPAGHPDLDPPHEALMLREVYAELQRDEAIKKRPADFQNWLAEGEKQGRELENALRAVDTAKAETAFKAVNATCASCHAVYRNVPQRP